MIGLLKLSVQNEQEERLYLVQQQESGHGIVQLIEEIVIHVNQDKHIVEIITQTQIMVKNVMMEIPTIPMPVIISVNLLLQKLK